MWHSAHPDYFFHPVQPTDTFHGCIYFSESYVRDIMTTLTGITTTFGIFIIYILGNLADWRTVALYCATVPIISFIALMFVRLKAVFFRNCLEINLI